MAQENWPDWDVYIRDRCRCVYCGLDGTDCFVRWQQLDVDHLIPKCRGGTNSHANKVVSCLRCNLMKGSLDPRGYADNLDTVHAEPKDADERVFLIKKAQEYIERNQKALKLDFEEMIRQIGSKKAATHF